MNYYQARQNSSTGKWDFTCMNDGKIWAVGYCAEAGGNHHDTEQEAVRCYGEYVLDKRLSFHPEKPGGAGTYSQCRVCNKLTNGYVEVDNSNISFLCDEHQNRESVAGFFIPPTKIMSSY